MVERPNIHVVGIAGSGMCAVAEASSACSYNVSGSDRYADSHTPLAVLATLKAGGCRIVPQDGSAVQPDTHAVITSSAIEADNPDLEAAREHGVPVYHRSEWLAKLIGSKPLLGIAGTSGKSTVTAMVGWILAQHGMNPFVVNGAAVSAWEREDRTGHVLVGSGDLWVVELDESDKSCLHFSPLHAVITNQSTDHFPVSETELLFRAFESKVQVSCLVGPWEHQKYRAALDGAQFVAQDTFFELPLLGKHNADNAVASARLCEKVGISFQNSAAALRLFPGVRRRLERILPSADRYVFDDFGHNPAKIAAAIQTVRSVADAVTVVWRPHGYGPLRNMMTELVSAFKSLATSPKSHNRHHRLLLLPVYDVGGTAQRDVQSGDLAALLKPCGVETQCLAVYDEVVSFCDAAAVLPGDAVLVMGARDPGLPRLARDIAKQYDINA